MARMPDLVAFAQRHGLKIGTIDDLIAYRLRNDQIVKRVARPHVESAHGGALQAARLRDGGRAGRASGAGEGRLAHAGPGAGARACRQRARPTCWASVPAAARRRSDKAMQAIAEEGRGVIVLIRDLRPKSVSTGWRRTPSASQHEEGRRRSGAWSRSASARRSCAISASATWSCSPMRRLALCGPGGFRAAHRRPAPDR